jgi:autotransporter-associated beta strand protein
VLTNGALNFLGSATPITVKSGVTATLKNTVAMGASSTIQINGGGMLSLAGGAAFAANTTFTGGGTVDLNSGTFTGANFAFWQQTPVTQEAATLNTGRIMVAYGGNCTYTMNNPSAQASSTGGGGDSFIGRAGSIGTWDLKQGTVTLTAVSGDNLRVGFDGSSKGTLTVEGGTFNLGGNILYINAGATSSGGAGTVNLSGGTLTAGSVQFGDGAMFSSGTTGALNVTGGTLYVGSGGISNNALGTLTSTRTLSGGILGASASWTSSLPMVLTNMNGNITFQAADSGNSAKDITLSGVLSGIGGLTKTGGGTLTLVGANTYTGGTTIDAGTLALTTTNNILMSYTNNGGTLKVMMAGVGSSLVMSNLACGGNSLLTFDLAGLGLTTAPVISSSNLTMNGDVSVNVLNASSNGTSVLLHYSGTRNGSGKFLTGTVPAGASIVDDAIGRKISLAYLPATAPVMTTIGYNATSIEFTGSNGTALITYRILSATNLINPTWLPILTNSFDNSGNFNGIVPLNSTTPAAFYRIVTP